MRTTPVRPRPATALGPGPRRRRAQCLVAALVVVTGALLGGWCCEAPLAAASSPSAHPPAGARTGMQPVGWRWPLAQRPQVTRGFDAPATPYGPGHRGVDLAGTPAARVRAAGDGVVGYAGLLAGRGVVTVLHAGGLRTTYEPVRALVHRGEHVRAGQVLGTLTAGHRGCPVAACLHWGLLRGATYLDPLVLFGVGEVRLLPLAAP